MSDETKVPQVLAEAESVRFWTEMDGPHFADLILNEMKAVRFGDVEYPVADFCRREFLIEIWNGSVKSITDWQEMDNLQGKPMIYWMSVGTLSGIIYGNVHPGSPTP